jgi:hypothetical protein
MYLKSHPNAGGNVCSVRELSKLADRVEDCSISPLICMRDVGLVPRSREMQRRNAHLADSAWASTKDGLLHTSPRRGTAEGNERKLRSCRLDQLMGTLHRMACRTFAPSLTCSRLSHFTRTLLREGAMNGEFSQSLYDDAPPAKLNGWGVCKPVENP